MPSATRTSQAAKGEAHLSPSCTFKRTKKKVPSATLTSDPESVADWENLSSAELVKEGWANHKLPDRHSSPKTEDWDDDDAGGGHPPQPAPGTMVSTSPVVTPCADGLFVRFTPRVFDVFEVTAKYTAPIGFIGGGAYGTVCYAFDSEKGKKVAIKKISNAFVDATHAKLALREVMLLRHMNHSNVVTLTDVIPPLQRDMFNDVYIAFEWMYTDMHESIKSNNRPLSDYHCKFYMHQLLSGLNYLHSANVLHRDLKPSNLLLNNDGVLKICDFGQARSIRQRKLNLSKGVGTLYYKAPEILLHTSAYGPAVDVWSAGCIFVELMLGKPLFAGVDVADQLRLIFEVIGTPATGADLSFLDRIAQSDVQGHLHHPRQSLAKKLGDVDTLAVDLAEKMLTFDPRQRITIEDALAHPYFKIYHGVSNQLVLPGPFSFNFEDESLSVEEIQDRIYNEALAFNPKFRKQTCGRNNAAWRSC